MREQKKGKKGIAPNYITRTRAVRYLQVTLKDFRRLCILKGIFPRDPKKKNAGKDKVYYHKKDIAFLAHEPLLAKFRELKIFMRRIKRAQSKKETGKLDKLQANRPRITLDHLVKERYPTFVDALRDLDDPLTMLHLFAALPNNTVRQHTDQTTAMCLRLCREFQHYVARTHSLRKVFLSIKGVYYQAEIMGQPITWLVPHQFAQKLPSDVDFRVMFTFLEFYMTMAKFINFKLFNELGLAYPPTFDMVAAARGAGMFSLHVRTKAEAEAAQRVTAAAKTLAAQVASRGDNKSQAQSGVDAVVQRLSEKEASGPSAEEAEAAELQRDMAEFDKLGGDQEAKTASLDVSSTVLPKLFAGSVFLLGREVPQDHMEFIISSAGGRCVRMEDLDGTAQRTDHQLKGTGMGKKRKAATPANQLSGTGASSNPLLKEKALSLDSPIITHHVIDRSSVANRVAGREYVQPQWLVDSFNARALLPTEPYAPGAALPPHLSPFVDDVKEGYIPKQREVLEQWGAHYDTPVTSAAKEQGAAQPAEEEDEEARYRKELENEAKGVSYSKAKQTSAADTKDEEDEEAEGDEDEEEEKEDELGEDSEDEYDDRSDYESEDEAAAKGRRAKVAAEPTLFAGKPGAKKPQSKQADSEDPKELAKLMMGKKAARLYSRMQHGIQAKQAVNDKLAARREEIESGGKKRKSAGAEEAAGDQDGADVDMEEEEEEEEPKPVKKAKGKPSKAPAPAAAPSPSKKQKAAPAPAPAAAKGKAKAKAK